MQNHTHVVDRYSAAVPIPIPMFGWIVGRGGGMEFQPGHLVQATDGVSGDVIVALVATVVVVSGCLVLWRRASDDATTRGAGDGAIQSRTGAKETTPEPRDDRTVVRNILETHGGRARQSVIVEETDWSKAKVSAVLADMDEDGDVSKLRVGRENIVSLPGHEPDAVGSPIDD